MMDLSNSSWMTTRGRFRHVSWKASERVKPPHLLGSEPPPDKEPRSSCADTQGASKSAQPTTKTPAVGPSPSDTHSRAGETAAHTPHHQRRPGVPEGLPSRDGARATGEGAAKAGPRTAQPQARPAPWAYPGSAGAVACTSRAHAALDQALGRRY